MAKKKKRGSGDSKIEKKTRSFFEGDKVFKELPTDVKKFMDSSSSGRLEQELAEEAQIDYYEAGGTDDYDD